MNYEFLFILLNTLPSTSNNNCVRVERERERVNSSQRILTNGDSVSSVSPYRGVFHMSECKLDLFSH